MKNPDIHVSVRGRFNGCKHATHAYRSVCMRFMMAKLDGFLTVVAIPLWISSFNDTDNSSRVEKALFHWGITCKRKLCSKLEFRPTPHQSSHVRSDFTTHSLRTFLTNSHRRSYNCLNKTGKIIHCLSKIWQKALNRFRKAGYERKRTIDP